MNEFKIEKQYPRMCGQQSGKLIAIEQTPAKSINPLLKLEIAGTLPEGNRSVILCLFLGEQLIPFWYAISWGTARLIKYQEMVGQEFKFVIKDEEKKNSLQPDIFEEPK